MLRPDLGEGDNGRLLSFHTKLPIISLGDEYTFIMSIYQEVICASTMKCYIASSDCVLSGVQRKPKLLRLELHNVKLCSKITTIFQIPPPKSSEVPLQNVSKCLLCNIKYHYSH